ncbi:MAG: hypothetical protein ISN26_00050 [Betaproteobacteria bacterium AqS2]|uniref:Uncharacterized protein n=1 Tax=Candidatus Amphirhobacter heronislandensis TaxID=1732024 RepID=A0A930Y0M6_9GAMM|nr:hypothetical protein [Betaproteobacteria bacterium AqS2]
MNPAFCALLLWRAAKGYVIANSEGLSFEEAFLILPMVLHRTTRETLPRDTRTSLAVWVNSNPLTQGCIATHSKSLVPFTRECLLFGGIRGALQIERGRLRPNDDWQQRIDRSLRDTSEEVRLCAKRAEFLGKWFAQTGDGMTVLALIGVRP